jgi:hypothetical protein
LGRCEQPEFANLPAGSNGQISALPACADAARATRENSSAGRRQVFEQVADACDAAQFLIKVALSTAVYFDAQQKLPSAVLAPDFVQFRTHFTFLEAPQNAAYNAPPFPAGRAKSAGVSRIYAMPHVAGMAETRWHFCCPTAMQVR